MLISRILALIIPRANLQFIPYLSGILISIVLTLINRHANLPYSYLNYPACNSPLFLP